VAFDIVVTPYSGKEAPFIPPDREPIEFELEPIQPSEPEPVVPVPDPFVPQPITYSSWTPTIIPRSPLIVNIESTGVMPTNSRIISIAAFDPKQVELGIVTFMDDSEEIALNEFLEFYRVNGYNEIISYNVAFDFRFVFATAMKHRVQAPEWVNSDLYDVMTQMEQVNQTFVPGFNKPGTLDDWAATLFGLEPPATQEEVLKAWASGNYGLVEEYNKYKVRATHLLWALGQYVFGEPVHEEESEASIAEPFAGEDTKTANCLNCMQEHVLPKSDNVFICEVCGTENRL